MTQEKEQKLNLQETLQQKKLVIFDFDGTLLDSMPMWAHIGTDYITSKGILPPPDLEETLISKTLEESGEYYIRELGLPMTVPEYLDDLFTYIEDAYAHRIPLKAGALDFVRMVAEQGKARCILTTTMRRCVLEAMKNHGLDQYIDTLYTCGELGMSKKTPDIYTWTVKAMGAAPEDTVLFEDAHFAIRSGKEAGLTVVSVYDDSVAEEQEFIRKYADFMIHDFRELV
jgi:HAD superfamily hydrolase (TIGR01509 family)